MEFSDNQIIWCLIIIGLGWAALWYGWYKESKVKSKQPRKRKRM